MTRFQRESSNKGFTLMEIMVVIIVIAVLASVAGPMIGTITDQGRASATRAQMANIKSALVSYKSDTGHYPHTGISAFMSGTNYNDADTQQLNNDIGSNVLTNGVANLYNIQATTWNARYKGPYMDSDPSDYMMDAWATKIKYESDGGKNLWLHSFGPDGVMDTPCSNITKDGYTGDDLVLSVAKLK